MFAYWNDGVRQFLIDNARFFLEEYRADGIRYDEVTVMHHHGGDRFCRDLSSTLRYLRPDAIQIAEYWDWDRAFPVTPAPAGLGFDAALGDGLRDACRGGRAGCTTRRIWFWRPCSRRFAASTCSSIAGPARCRGICARR